MSDHVALPQSPWYGDGLRFECTQCGQCCTGAPGYVWVDGEEIERIAAFLGMPVAAFNRKHVRRVWRGRSLLEKRNGDCEFLEWQPDGRAHCRVHQVRPTQCRTWPFWGSNVKTPEAWEETGKHCPGVNQGALHELDEIHQALRDNGTRPL